VLARAVWAMARRLFFGRWRRRRGDDGAAGDAAWRFFKAADAAVRSARQHGCCLRSTSVLPVVFILGACHSYGRDDGLGVSGRLFSSCRG